MPYCVRCGKKVPEDATFCPYCGSPVRIQLETRFKKADWGERFIAWIIDMIIVGIIIVPFKWYIGWMGMMTWRMPFHVPRFIPFIDLGFDNIVYFLYWTFMEGVYGQSLGKMVMKLKVIQSNGERIDLLQAAIESIGKAFLLPLDCIIGWILYPQDRQRFFNRISETIVVEVRG